MTLTIHFRTANKCQKYTGNGNGNVNVNENCGQDYLIDIAIGQYMEIDTPNETNR